MINRDWHETHRMPKNATIEQRIDWHIEHAEQCGCRDIPESVNAPWSSVVRRFRYVGSIRRARLA